MPIRILADSCCDLTPTLKNLLGVTLIPLELRPGSACLTDDETLDPFELLKLMKATKEATKTACPAPETYAAAMRAGDECIVITLSSKLSGSYNAACIGRDMVLEEEPEKKIFVLDSESASAGETRLALQLFDLIRAGLPFEEVVAQICPFRDRMHTLFVLEDLSNLIKNGRIGNCRQIRCKEYRQKNIQLKFLRTASAVHIRQHIAVPDQIFSEFPFLHSPFPVIPAAGRHVDSSFFSHAQIITHGYDRRVRYA